MNNYLQSKMTKLLVIIGSCLVVTTANSCQRKHEGSGGSVVGNGFIHFHNKTFDFAFSYSRDLALTANSDRDLRLDNSTIASQLGLKASAITFSVVSSASATTEGLEQLAATIDPSAAWRSIETSGVKGVFYQQRSNTNLDARYLFQIDEMSILDVHATAIDGARGIELITSVLDSITFDTQPPVIHEVYFEPAIVRAGETAKLKIRATDNMTEIRGMSPRGSVSIGLEERCRELLTKDWQSLEACGEFRAIGDDWYEYDIPTSPKTKPGRYILHPISIWDSAGNSITLVADHDRGVYHSSDRFDEAQLPILYLQVDNDSPDLVPPTLQNVHFEPEVINAGESGKLVFQSQDNDRDYFPKGFCEKARHVDWFKFTRTDIPTSAEVDPTEYSVLACEQPTKRADGFWEVPFKSERGLPPGEYNVDFRVNDLANNKSEPISATLLVHGKAQIDLRGPEVWEIKTDRSSYKRGDKGQILIRATDDISGVVENLKHLSISLCKTGFVPGSVQSLDYNDKQRIPLCDSAFRHVNGDWYSIEFTISDKAPFGRYVLPEITIQDRVGNKTFISKSTNDNGVDTYVNTFSGESLKIPVISIDVVD